MLAWHAEGVTKGVPLMEWTFIRFLICWELLEPPSLRCQHASGMLAWHAGSVTKGIPLVEWIFIRFPICWELLEPPSLRCQHASGMLAWHAEGVTEGVPVASRTSYGMTLSTCFTLLSIAWHTFTKFLSISTLVNLIISSLYSCRILVRISSYSSPSSV